MHGEEPFLERREIGIGNAAEARTAYLIAGPLRGNIRQEGAEVQLR